MDFADRDASRDASLLNRRAALRSRMAGLIGTQSVQAQLDRGVVPEPQWRAGLRGICAEAREECVPPEQLLREVKEALSILCDACAIPHGQMRTKFAGRVVTLCIEEYFATRPADGN